LSSNEHYERNLRLTEVDPNQRAVVPFNSEVVTIRVKEKKSVIYASKYFGIMTGFKPHQDSVRNEKGRDVNPDYLSTAALAFTTKHIDAGGNSTSAIREKRALFGEHGCIPGTLKR